MTKRYRLIILFLCFILFGFENSEMPSLSVKHIIKGKNILVECILTDITFRTDESYKKHVGKIIVWVDGKKHSEETGAAFIIEGLASGNHDINLEVTHLNNQPYGLKKHFQVNIP